MSRRQFYQASWFKGLAGLVIVLILVPIILRPVLVKLLVDNGFEQASIEQININWFTGVVAIEGVALEHGGQPKLALDWLRVDLGWLALLRGELLVESVEVSGAEFAVIQRSDNSWEVVSAIPPSSDEQSAQSSKPLNLPKLGLTELILTTIKIHIKSEYASGELLIDKLSLQRLSSWRDHMATLSIAAKWNDAPVVINLQAKPFHSNPQLKGRVAINRIALGAISALLPDDFSEFDADLTITGDISLTRQSNDVLSADITTDVAINNSRLNYRNLALDVAKIHWAGDVNVKLQPTLAYQLNGDFVIEKLLLKDYEQNLDVISFESLAVQTLSVDQQQAVSFQQLLVNDLSAIKVASTTPYWLSHEQLKLDNLMLQLATEQPTLSLASLAATGGEYNIVINKQGGFLGQAELEAVFKPLVDAPQINPKAPNDNTGTTPPLRLSIGELLLDKSALTFQDQQFKQPYRNKLYIDRLSVNQLNQAKPEQLSPLQIQARLGEFSDIDFSGEVAPFAAELKLSLKGQINSLPLPELSPYTEAYLGYQLLTGHYDHAIDLSVGNNRLDMKNKLKLRRLQVKSAYQNSAEKITKGLGMPLPLALSMLRDRNDVISLNVPLKGDLDNFNVGIGDVINQALVKALKTGSTSYLLLALQPYGAAIMAADMLVKQAGTIRFEPVVFMPGSVELAPETIPYIDKLQGMLREREGLSLTLCGRSTVADQQQLGLSDEAVSADEIDPQLLALASDRANTLKRQFVEAGIKGARLYICKPSFDSQAVPSVMLTM